MIPLKLTLRNFLSYRDDNPALDLTGIRVACLCGNNGHGKSALLDGVTWALWGKARGSGHADLIHYGRSDMMVELEFQAAGAHYRVIRRYSVLSGSNLQLQLKGPGGFYPLTGNSIRQSQAKLNRVIGMDYDTFINSAFLIQGRADEFTNKTPAERKEVLGKIIGLDRFNELRQRSRDKMRDRARQGDELEGRLKFMRQETAAKEKFQEELSATVQNLNKLIKELDEKTGRANNLRLKIQQLERRIADAEDIQRRIPHLQAEISQYEAEARQRSVRISDYQSLIDRQPSIQDGFTQYQHSLTENQRLNAARARFDELNREINSLQQAVAQAKARLEEQLRSQQRRLRSELEPAAQQIPELEKQLAKSVDHVAALEKQGKALSDKQSQLQKIVSRVATLRDTQERLFGEGQEIRGKLNLLNSSHGDTRCPLCDTSLGAEGCIRLEQSYSEAIQDKGRQYKGNEAVLKEAQTKRDQLSKQVKDDEVSLQRQEQQALRRTALLERQLEDSRRAEVESARLRPEVKRLEKSLLDGQFAPDQQSEIDARQSSLESLNYSPHRHSDLFHKLQALQKYQLLHQQLSEAHRNLPQEQATLAQAQQAAQDRRDRLSQIRESLSTLASDRAHLTETNSQLQRLSSDINNLESRQQNLIAHQGRLQGSIQRIEELERQITRQTRDLRRIREEQSIYEELRVAFGREGVQALLIDTILPQIEQEANNLLARMTEGRMTVKLESQRPLRSQKGRLAETLEIKVSDELGHRSYEMFSGGEAFRINLALRIALSKVLANRSGAPLPTLFIDEGFGTQDSAGREQILDVLSTLEQDFKCIIVITHLEELKDYFPVRIEVQKQNGASTAHIT